jgi:hypothetical protein
MSRIHGRNGRIYMGLASSAASAEPLADFATWDINFTVDKAEVTALGDSNKVYVAGLPDASGTFDGFYDDATVQTYTAAVDGQPRKFYLYPNTTNTGQYWFGTILPDFAASGGVAAAVSAKSSWNAASSIQKVG